MHLNGNQRRGLKYMKDNKDNIIFWRNKKEKKIMSGACNRSSDRSDNSEVEQESTPVISLRVWYLLQRLLPWQ